MRRADSGVDDVSLNAGAGSVIGVCSVEWKISLVDAIESPRGACLRCTQRNDAILFDKRDLWIVCEAQSLLFVHAHRETLECAMISLTVITIATEITCEAMSRAVDVGDVVFENDDVLIGNSFVRAHAPEFIAVGILTVNCSEDYHCYRNSYESKNRKRFLHMTSSEISCCLGASAAEQSRNPGERRGLDRTTVSSVTLYLG